MWIAISDEGEAEASIVDFLLIHLPLYTYQDRHNPPSKSALLLDGDPNTVTGG